MTRLWFLMMAVASFSAFADPQIQCRGAYGEDIFEATLVEGVPQEVVEDVDLTVISQNFCEGECVSSLVLQADFADSIRSFRHEGEFVSDSPSAGFLVTRNNKPFTVDCEQTNEVTDISIQEEH